MTTMTSHRTPHALHAGRTPALTWLVLKALDLATDLFVVLGFPLLGLVFAEDRDNLYDMAVLFCLGVLAASVLRWFLARALRLRVPGALGRGTQADVAHGPATPDLVAQVVRCGVLACAAFAAAQLSATEDGGFAAVVLTAFGAALVALGASAAAREILNFPHDWPLSVLHATLNQVLPGVAMLVAGTVVAPGENAPTVAVGALAACSVAVVELGRSAFVGSFSAAKNLTDDAAVAAGETLLARGNPAPTLDDHARAQDRARVAIYALLAAGAVLVIVALEVAAR